MAIIGEIIDASQLLGGRAQAVLHKVYAYVCT